MTAAAAPPVSISQELEQLAKDKKDGILTDEEFAKAKAKLLSS